MKTVQVDWRWSSNYKDPVYLYIIKSTTKKENIKNKSQTNEENVNPMRVNEDSKLANVL